MIEGLLICYFIFNFLMILGYFGKVVSMKEVRHRPLLLTHIVNVMLLAAGGTLFIIAMLFYIIYLEWLRN